MKRRIQMLTSADAQPFRKQHSAPCSDCPWARKSLKGWTGSNTSAQWLHVARDYWHPIACHTRRVAEDVLIKAYTKGSIDNHLTLAAEGCLGHWQCAGAAIYRANTSVFRFPTRPWLQLPANRISVFASPAEFLAHHGEGIDINQGGRSWPAK
jgi:hypothetical protein